MQADKASPVVRGRSGRAMMSESCSGCAEEQGREAGGQWKSTKLASRCLRGLSQELQPKGSGIGFACADRRC